MKKGIKQPEVIIGLFGHIAHGKTTLIKAITGKLTLKHSEELKRGMTIKLGYALGEIRVCPDCEGFDKYTSSKICKKHNKETKLLRRVYFVDAPGHEALMATALSGASLIDGAILVIAANEGIRAQTKEHLLALKLLNVKNIIVVQNKIDLVSDEEAKKGKEEIKKLLKEYLGREDIPIIPVSAQSRVNIDVVLKAILDFIPTPQRDLNKEPIMLVVRSFDVNLPGSDVKDLKGSVLGGALKQGKLKVGDKIKILPGLKIKEKNVEEYRPLITSIRKIMVENEVYDEILPGTSFAIETSLDPYLGRNDNLGSSIVVKEDSNLSVTHRLKIRYNFIERAIVKATSFSMNEPIVIHLLSQITVGVIKSLRNDIMEVYLKRPIVNLKGEKIAISKRIEGRWRLVAVGEII